MDATNLLKEYIDTNFAQRRVIVLGDLNDSLTDMTQNNVFTSLLNDPDNYRFADHGDRRGRQRGMVLSPLPVAPRPHLD